MTTYKNVYASSLECGTLKIQNNVLESINPNSDIYITPNGFGEVLLKNNPSSSLGAVTKQYVDILFNTPTIGDVKVKTTSSLSYIKTGSGAGLF